MDADFMEFLRQYQLAMLDRNETDRSAEGNETWSDDGFYVADGFGIDPNGSSADDAAGWPSASLGHFDFVPDQLPAGVLSVFTVLYIVIMILGLGGNATTVLVIALNREMRTVTNVFLVSLAVSDALIAGVNMPVQLRFYTENEWTLGEHACKLIMYLQGVVIVSSILTLTSLAIDRYYAICHPLRARHVHTTTRVGVLVSIIWVASLLLVSPQLFIQRLEPMLMMQIDQEPQLRVVQVCVEYFSTHFRGIAYTTFHYVVLYVFPVVTMFVTYGTIASKLWHRQPIGETLSDSHKDSMRRLKEKKRIVCMLVLIVALFSLSWFPFFTVQLYLLIDPDGHRTSSVHMTVAILQLIGYSNCCVNPIVYCFLNDSFQKHLLRTLRCRCVTCLFLGVKGRRGVSYRGGNAAYAGVGTTSPVVGNGSGTAVGSAGAPVGGSKVDRTFDRRHRRRSSCTTDTAINGTTTVMTSAAAACVVIRAPVEHGCSTAV